MILTFSVVETKSPRVRRLVKNSTPQVVEGTELVIVDNVVVLDGRRVAAIIEYGSVFMTDNGNFNKLVIG